MEDLLWIYNRLSEISGVGDLYSARALPDRPRYRVARDADGNPTLLVALDSLSDETGVLPLELHNLSFRPRCVCRVQIEGSAETLETLAVLKCTSEDSLLREYFLRSISGTVASLPAAPSETDITGAVTKLVELFRALEAPPRSTLQGLWCELFLIARGRTIRHAASAWHEDPSELYDFRSGTQMVEVKSSAGPHRIHHFRMDQLLPRQGERVVIASFMLEETVVGLSITDLWEEVRRNRELTDDIRDRISQILALCLGHDWRKAGRIAFNPESAASLLRLYDAFAIPRVDSNIPVEVSDVQFRSELTDVPSLTRSEVARNGGLFMALFG